MPSKQSPFQHLLAHLDTLVDPRIERSKLYPLGEILFQTIAAVISGLETWEEIADFGQQKRKWLRKYLPYANGTPSHDTLNRVFSLIDYQHFERCFLDWACMELSLPEGSLISIDGKTLRSSVDKHLQQLPHREGGKTPLQLLHAYCGAYQWCLAQHTISEGNEITAIPTLLEMLDIQGSIISIDAIGCQKSIAKAIVDKEADYILSVKSNQEALELAIFTAFEHTQPHTQTHTQPQTHTTHTHQHGREEIRQCQVLPVEALPDWADANQWEGLQTIVQIHATRRLEATGQIHRQTRYFISSLQATAAQLSGLIRAHWAIENQLHWTMDVVFGEDYSQKQIRNAAQNFAAIRKIAFNLLKANPEKISLQRKRTKAALSDSYRENILKI